MDTEVIFVKEETRGFFKDKEPPSKRRIIRSHYREIGKRIHEDKYDIANGASNKFMKIMDEVENMHQHVNTPREQVADAEALLGLTTTLLASVKTHTTGDITPTEFISCLIRDFCVQKPMQGISADSPNISWKRINRQVSPIFKNAPGCRTMFRHMEFEHKQWNAVFRARQCRPRTYRPKQTYKKDKPKVIGESAEAVTNTDRNIRLMFEILKNKKRVKVENLILNRTSFARTIENLFALSFLAKDGRVKINVDDADGSQVIIPTNGPRAGDIMAGVVKNHQFVFRMDFSDWEVMKIRVAQGEEVMPQRDEVSAQNHAGNSPSLHTTTPVKLSMNNGHAMQSCDLTGTGKTTILGSEFKHKRCHS